MPTIAKLRQEWCDLGLKRKSSWLALQLTLYHNRIFVHFGIVKNVHYRKRKVDNGTEVKARTCSCNVPCLYAGRILITCDRKRWFWRFFWPGGDFKTVATYIIPDERQCILETEIPRKAYVPELTSFQLQSPNVKLSYHELENSSNMRLPSLVAVAVLFFAATSLTAPTPGPGSDIARRGWSLDLWIALEKLTVV
jgi:hypothetical protein